MGIRPGVMLCLLDPALMTLTSDRLRIVQRCRK
jgi:hypothetical protein